MPRFYTKDHEWIDIDAHDGVVGITDYAQRQLGDITFIDLPAEGASFAAGDTAAVVDSVKAASDIFAPMAGTVTALNAALADTPEVVNSDAEGAGWLFRVTLADPTATADLMDHAAYQAYIAGL